MKYNFAKNQYANRCRGFTLIEIVVVVFIIGIITATSVYNHRQFTDSMEITNLAYDLSLTIREVQARAAGGQYESAQGIHFNISDNPNFFGSKSAFVIFSDSDEPADNVYAAGNYTQLEDCGNSECVEVIQIGRGNLVEKICIEDNDFGSQCFTESGPITGFDLSFMRPKADANIRFRQLSGGVDLGYSDREAVLCLISPAGRGKSIHISRTGLIAVEEACQ